jgi:predicted transcriptional regulator
MSKADASLKSGSESVRISREVKKRLQKYSRRYNQPLRRVLDKAIRIYVREQTGKELH